MQMWMNVQTVDITVTHEPIVLMKKAHFHVRVYEVILETETCVKVSLIMIWKQRTDQYRP